MNKNTVGAAARDLRETLELPTVVMAYKIGRGCCDLMIQRTAPDELSPQMIIHDLTALKVNKLPAMQRSIDAAIEIIREAKV